MMESYEKDYQKLIADYQNTFSPDDIEKIKKAYSIACEAHANQKRRSGEPYIIHPVAVAKILAEMGMDAEPNAMLEEIKDIRRRLAVYAKRGEADRAYETEPTNSEVVK